VDDAALEPALVEEIELAAGHVRQGALALPATTGQRKRRHSSTSLAAIAWPASSEPAIAMSAGADCLRRTASGSNSA
jgi:hypothetical protein